MVDLHNVLSRLNSIERISENTVAECGDMPSTPPSTINISISASGDNNIKSMLQMLNKLSEIPASDVVTTDPVPLTVEPTDTGNITPCGMSVSYDQDVSKLPVFNGTEVDVAGGFGDTDSEPKPDLTGANYMNNTLAGGMNKPKDAYPRVSPGDNPMKYAASESFKESIRSELQKRLNEIKNR